MYRTDWFRFQVQVHNSQLLKLDPVNISARRVRVLESRNGKGNTRRELVRDVVVVGDAESDGDAAKAEIGSRER
jgi:hypothetical protein